MANFRLVFGGKAEPVREVFGFGGQLRDLIRAAGGTDFAGQSVGFIRELRCFNYSAVANIGDRRGTEE